ncbi:hypothetical protein Pint_17693 [Pistacia integerrima]|uniref:Uncharacterized protein n=1 Tax=Pistacia integerrima TaxID=434235 RepID=A0ACC0YZG3_9ROSI|nr:hypothetical protein Pint_17693 [Pistacia integerrima]
MKLECIHDALQSGIVECFGQNPYHLTSDEAMSMDYS